MAVSTQPTSSQPGASGPSAGRSSLVEMQARRCMYLASHFAHRPSLRLCEPVASPTEEVQNAHMSRKPGLVSIGYEGRTAEDLVAALVEARVDIVADIRLTPMSRKPGLSKTKLSQALEAAGVEYVHLRALGNPKENREPFWSGRAAAGVKHFRKLMKAPVPAAALDELALLARTRRVAVLCFEREHERRGRR